MQCQRCNRVKYLLVQYEEDPINPPKYDIVQESRLVPPPIGEIGELFSGKLVYVGTLNGSKRSKLLSMSEDYQTLQIEVKQLERNYQNEIKFNELENTIKNLQQKLETYKRTVNTKRNRRLSNPYDNPRPSTSARSDTAERSKPTSTNLFRHSNNASQMLTQKAVNINESLADLSRDVRYLEERLLNRMEADPRINNNRRILITPTSSDSEDSYDVSSEQVDVDMERENNPNNRHFPRNSTVARNGQPIEAVNFELNDREETPRTTRRMKRRSRSHESTDSDTMRIGPGKTEVSKHIMSQLDWTSHTMATRKLLTAVFPRKVLATHTLTGKSAPAFPNKPPKLCLDPVRVQDIIVTVSKKCQVKENLVRNAITTKCADENKMYRNREARKKQNKEKKENCDPKNNSSTANSSSSTNNGSSP